METAIVTLRYHGKQPYRGFDEGLETPVSVDEGQLVAVSEKMASRLLSDFPLWFEVINPVAELYRQRSESEDAPERIVMQKKPARPRRKKTGEA